MMKLTALLLFTGLMSVSASIYSQATKLTMDLENVSIHEVFRQIEANSEFVFIYKNEVVDLDKRVNIKVRKSTVETILDELFREAGVKYEVLNKQIILTPDRSIPSRQADLTEAAGELAPPPGKMLSGSVTDSKGEPIPGVSVVIKGTTTGTVTGIDGKFTLSVPDDAKVLSFSFVGFITQEVPIGAQTSFKIVLKEATVGVEEVVIIGYGEQKKETLVGAVANVKADELEKTGAMANLGQALTGQLAGLTTILSSGEPGNDDPVILIRGKSTWNEAQPLILVDGIERRMNDIDVREVESVSILKDASATAVYGVKGAEGVILVTTKRGKMGKPQLSVDGDFGVKFLSRTPDKLDAYESLKYRNYSIENELAVKEAGWGKYIPLEQLNRYKKPQAPGDEYLFPNVDWPKEMLKDFATSKRVNINVSGGTKFAKYFGSLSYLSEGDLMNSGIDNGKGYQTKWAYNRFNYRTNIDFNLTPSTVLSANLSGYVGTKFEGYSTEDGTGTLFRAFYAISPSAFPVRYADGTWGYNINFSNIANPVATLNNGGLEKVIRSQVNTDFKLTQKLDFITKGLEVGASLSYDNLFYTSGGVFEVSNTVRKYVDPDIIEVLPGGVYSDEAVAALPAEIRDQYVIYDPSQGTNYFDYYQQPVSYYAEGVRAADYWGANNYLNQIERRLFYQFQISYAKQFGKHDMSLLALMNREEYAKGSMFPRYREDWVGRVTYNYDGKYLFETNGAYNGSEKFADKYRFGFFPSLAVGWVASGENFLKKQDWLDLLKFRYSVGKVGNDNFTSARWAYETTWKIDSPNTPFGYPAYGLSPYTQTIESVIGNPDLHWEKSTKHNLGIELGLLNMFTVNADFFHDHREDVFMSASQRNVVAYFGALPVAANLGETKTKGFEVEVKFQKTTKRGLNYWAEWAYTRAIDEVIYMEDPELLPAYQKKAGFQIDQTTATMHDGFITSWDGVYSSTSYASLSNSYKLPGDYRILDFNGDGQIDSYDSAPYGYPLRPQNTYNFELGFNYKGFSAYVQFYGVYNVTREVYLTPWSDEGTYSLAYDLVSDYYTAENTDAAFRGGRFESRDQSYNGTFFMFDGSYLRLKTAEVSYQFTGPWLKSLGLSSARLYLNGNNLWFWSDMPDDRESNTSRVTYPTYKRINLGVNLNF
ncbi:MAG: TonB-dependent receptor [Mangrovibacterium sp.]|nr:TonB-dependent receptor [Mangrovibacterium sp.]